jgi:hypothetical protein
MIDVGKEGVVVIVVEKSRLLWSRAGPGAVLPSLRATWLDDGFVVTDLELDDIG